ncbi:hypothetical protein QWY82_07115 [Simiduia curdlanivorans]|uniref:DUF3316 domain-containing protein n=1 Tax=Simiduia curdlanivorans TaxID=1492769 RepID=A0ABV8V5P5_9GAMM|nr:hypothetical protein [Simiduia curdlanivorans]MDN3638571.1 hypothetical protein [Simiduia curdlanivorans]
MKTTLAALLTLTAVALCPACLAGETFSQTFYTGEDSALEQATTQAIHFQHYAQLAKAKKVAPTSSGIQSLLNKAVSTSQLERPTYSRGFQIQTLSTDDGMELSAAYRF